MIKFKKLILPFLAVFILSSVAAFAAGDYAISPAVDDGGHKSAIDVEIRPGSSTKGEFIVSNLSDKEITLNLFALDRQENKEGENSEAFLPESKDDSKDYVGKWLTLAVNEVTLAAKESKKINFKIEVPKDTLEQEYAGLIMAAQAPKEGQDDESFINVGTSVGVRVYTSVSKDAPETETITDKVVNVAEDASDNKATTAIIILAIIAVAFGAKKLMSKN